MTWNTNGIPLQNLNLTRKECDISTIKSLHPNANAIAMAIKPKHDVEEILDLEEDERQLVEE